MPEQQITNPQDAFKTTADLRVGYTDSEELHALGGTYRTFRANEAITKGEALMWVAATATVPLSVGLMTAAAADTLFVGCAMEAAAAGDDVLVCLEGYCLADVAAETTAFGTVIGVPGTTTGKVEVGHVSAYTNDIGIALYAKDASNLAPVMLRTLG
jgi:hypothetical protein